MCDAALVLADDQSHAEYGITTTTLSPNRFPPGHPTGRVAPVSLSGGHSLDGGCGIGPCGPGPATVSGYYVPGFRSGASAGPKVAVIVMSATMTGAMKPKVIVLGTGVSS